MTDSYKIFSNVWKKELESCHPEQSLDKPPKSTGLLSHHLYARDYLSKYTNQLTNNGDIYAEQSYINRILFIVSENELFLISTIAVPLQVIHTSMYLYINITKCIHVDTITCTN